MNKDKKLKEKCFTKGVEDSLDNIDRVSERKEYNPLRDSE